MKVFYVTFLIILSSFVQLVAQSTIILPNGTVIPSMTQANRPNTPTVGQLIYQTDGTSGLYVWSGTAWTAVSAGSGTVTNVTANAPISVANGTTTPALSISQANSTTNGFLSSADWSIFNNKQNALSSANATTNGILTSADWNTFSNKGSFNLPSLTDGSVLFSDGTTISQNNSSLKWNNSLRRLDIKGLNDGTIGAGFTNWISTSIGGSGGNRIVAGVQNGEATIGAHNETLSGWSKLVINPAGATAVGSLVGVGNRMVVANAEGELSTQAIPTGNIGTVTNVVGTSPILVTNGTSTPTIAISQANSATNGFLSSIDWTIFNNKQNALPNASTSTSGILTNTDWNTFNNKQNTLPNANSSTSGILTNTDWTIFNNKQNTLPNASTSTSGILTSTDWNNFNNKFNLPALTNGSVLFSNGSNLAQNNGSFFWDDNNIRLGIGTNVPNAKLTVSSTNAGSGTNDWVAGNFGGALGDRVVLGLNDGRASVGAYTSNLQTPAVLHLNPAGAVISTNSHAIGFVSGTPTPTASFEVAKKIDTYTGNFVASMGAYSNTTCLAAGTDCSSIFDGSQGSFAQASGGYQIGAGRYYVAKETIRRVEVSIGAIGAVSSITGNVLVRARNSTAESYVTLISTTFSGFGTFGVNFNNTTPYIYYQVLISSVTTNLGLESSPWMHELVLYKENITTTYNAGGLIVTNGATVGINTASPTANLDVNGSVRFRPNASAGKVLVSDDSGNAAWNNHVVGVGGLKISSTNVGSGTSDWIASNIGGTSGDRVVAGILNGKATIGAHNSDLNTWSNLAINNGGGIVTIGGDATTPASLANGAHGRPLSVNGSIRQGFYIVPVNVPANGVSYVTWTHNLGYGPIVMMSTDQNGGGNNMDYVTVTTFNNDTNQTVFILRNSSGVAANGALRWILVW